MKLKLGLLLIALIPLVLAQEENYNTYSELEISYELDSSLYLTSTGYNPTLERLTANLSLFPRSNFMTQITSLAKSANPNAIINQDDNIIFEWRDGDLGTYEYSVSSIVKTKNEIFKVSPQQFPIIDLPEDIKKYTEASEIIDINQDIINQANEIVAGETDLFTVVYKIAEWTRGYVPYDLNTLTADASQKSSWVYANKQGVCDEITGLFISLLRSVGIPARFVAGMVYTNIGYEFGAHGWAEVYFPEDGWVPFDPTFGQYGWVDPSHVKLAHYLDSGEPSVRYSWLSSNIDVETNELNLETSLISTGDKLEPIYDLSISPLVNDVGPGSYVPIRVSIENPFDKYTSTSAIITVAPELVEESNVKHLLLKPNKGSNAFWIVKLQSNLQPNFLYTTKVEAKDTFGSTDDAEIRYSLNNEVFTLEEAQELIESLEEQEEKTFSEKLSLTCLTARSYYYNYENIDINCNLKNTGNTYLENINICLLNNCQKTTLRIGQEENINFNAAASDLSSVTIINAKNPEVDVNYFLNLNLLNEPGLGIKDLDYPTQIDYNDELIINFKLESQPLVKNINIKINNVDSFIQEFQGTKEISIKTSPKHFLDNNINIKITYQDENGNSYETSETSTILVTNLPWYAYILRLFAIIF